MRKGFQSEIFDSQQVFRKLLDAMARPGQIQTLQTELDCPADIHPASGAILLTLLDGDTLFWSGHENASEESQWLRFHTGVPFTRSRGQALFALVTDCDSFDDPNAFCQGTVEAPYLSATIIVQTLGIDNSGRMQLTGPGVQNGVFLGVKGIKEEVWQNRAIAQQAYPMGVDLIFVHENRFVSLPRTTRLEIF